MRRAKLTLALLACLGALATLVAPAQADAPSWHLATATRPAKVEPGVASDAVQQLTLSATGGTFVLKREEPLASGGEKETAALAFNVSHEALQRALEGLYGAGNVTVAGGPGDAAGSHPYLISFGGAFADQPVGRIVSLAGSSTLTGGRKEANVTVIDPGRSDAELVVTATNLGTAAADGSVTPVRIVDTLPPNLRAVGILAVAPGPGGQEPAAFPCNLATLTCEFSGRLAPYDRIEVRIDAVAEPGIASGEQNEVAISGGGAPSTRGSSPIALVAEPGEPTPFGVAVNELSPEEVGGSAAIAAASHPFQVTSTLILDQGPDASGLGRHPTVEPAAMPKDFDVKLPPGLIGNPKPLPQCSLGAFLTLQGTVGGIGADACPPQDAIGVVTLDINEPNIAKGFHTFTVPIFNLEPAFGEPARFGFYIPIASQPVLLSTRLRDGEGEPGAPDYGVTVSAVNITQTIGFIDSSITFWGTPGDPRHDASRGWGCLAAARGEATALPCEATSPGHPAAFQTLPTRCEAPLLSTLAIDSWADPADFLQLPTTAPLPTLGSCNQLLFNPAIAAESTTDAATSGSGFNFDLDFSNEGLLNSNEGALAESEAKRAVVTLPEGFTSNPSLAAGLKACTEAEYEASTRQPGTGCTEESKIGTVEVESPLVAPKLDGSLFVAEQQRNPNHNLLTLYLVVQNPELGILIKQALKVTPNPVTGQLTTEVDEIPQLPFARFHLAFRSGQRSPLITPPACGTYAVKAQLFPYSQPNIPVERESAFQIVVGPEGQPCPSGGVPPFHPDIQAGTLNNVAGTYSPFYARIFRKDSEGEITHTTITMPPGLAGNLTGVEKCSDGAIQAAKARERVLGAGQQEQEHPSCPAGSEIGHTLVGTGVGTVLAYAPGKLYLAGPYKGAPLSVVSITAAKIGPFDIGTVVIRFGLIINPTTAQVEVNGEHSDPIPHIVDGIVVHVRDIRVYADRPQFTFNPTSCNPMQITGTIGSADNVTVAETARFQAADCANLAFKPSFKLSTSAKTSRAKGASLSVKLTYPAGALGKEANIKSVKVDLPRQLPSNLEALKHACIDTTFDANPAACPAESRIGEANATTPILPVPLTGPAYFVSHGGAKFPELVIVLQGYGITVQLHGETFINNGITSSTFHTIPDVPVGSFELNLPQRDKYAALAAPGGNLCNEQLSMPTLFTAQNGMVIKQNTTIEVTGCPYALRIVHRTVKKRTLTLKISVPVAGRLAATGKGVSRAAKTAKGRSTLTLTLKEGRAGKLRTKVLLRFTPAKGKQRKVLRKSITVRFG